MWFQQDDATSHTARATADGSISWSLNLTLWWFALAGQITRFNRSKLLFMGFLKSRVYKNKPQTLEALKENIRKKIENISPEVRARVMENAIKRARLVINCNGGHLADIKTFDVINSNGLSKQFSKAEPNVFVYKKKLQRKYIGWLLLAHLILIHKEMEFGFVTHIHLTSMWAIKTRPYHKSCNLPFIRHTFDRKTWCGSIRFHKKTHDPFLKQLKKITTKSCLCVIYYIKTNTFVV